MDNITQTFLVVKMTDGKFLSVNGDGILDPYLTTTSYLDCNRYDNEEYAMNDVKIFESGEYDEFKSKDCRGKDIRFEKFMKIKVVTTLEEE